MSTKLNSYRDFVPRPSGGSHLIGTFINTSTTHAAEILGLLGFDFIVFDMEHAAISLDVLDQVTVAAQPANVAAVIRVAERSWSALLLVLDAGMTSVLMPGILSRARAKAIVTASRYRDRKRSFVNATRAGECGSRGFEAYKVAQDRETACIATIEDLEAVLIDDILLVRGHDAIFIGRGDLAAALGCKTIEAPRTKKAVSIMMAGALRHRIPAIAINGDDAEAMAAPRSTDIHDRFRPSLHVQIYARRSYDAYGSKKGE